MTSPTSHGEPGLKGKHVLITGAGGGIGQALIEAYNGLGAIVSGADQQRRLIESLPLSNRLVFDLNDKAAASKAIGDFIADRGVPDVLINNAGFTRGETLDQVDGDVWEQEIATNLNGVFHVTAPIVANMSKRGSGNIVFISSVNALGHYGNPAYSAAKAGLISYMKALAVERGRFGIRANAVCPGSVRTPAWDHRLQREPELLAKVLPHYPLGRMVTPDEVAQAAVFLSSSAASGITGATLNVDAGLTAGNLPFINDVLGD
ncbi:MULTISPECIES: SDR family oxidoreductase [Phyllobacterium]|uniref:NAD(P)-dependent dehydrogenase (Short-subunit alcohol dehydrogenase family) n=1 Tax=Phyllobacterium trifolii TaxID=300193 RepID=A0A839U8D6_9HYPH|nr:MULTISPECIES: SDR family oxidoreductase [Phyllobacterium]MBB3147048.1 NAD(P)-dependent dehydrogenase (short-subunit alcohol dehydrogenase family) [Phyllobacterium trifolii]MBZ9601470.1 SDR family oxidoreductase [Phyllobacterium sp. KW56]